MFVTTFVFGLWHIFVIIIVATYLKFCKNYDCHLFEAMNIYIVYCKLTGG